MNEINSKQDLINYINHENQVEYLFFWGHQPKQNNLVSKSCFSQWYEAGFEVDGLRYQTAEHFMMAEKARLFGDEDILCQIIAAKNPGTAKKLGREVKKFNQEEWLEHRFEIVVKGNIAKFKQNPELRHFLDKTGSKILVEASPKDCIWGIGLEQSNPDCLNPYKWRGLNLLGFALMKARNILNHQ